MGNRLNDVLAHHFRVDEQLLRGGREEPSLRFRTGSLIPIARYNVNASAGHGALHDDERMETPLAFDAAWTGRLERPQDQLIG